LPIVPDDKDWTWVLERPCPECAFNASGLPSTEVAPLIRANAAAWAAVLAQPVGTLRARPRDDCWSPLEYACHVRDVFRLFDRRLGLMLAEDNPLFLNWDQDRTAVDDRYNEQDPAEVAADLAEAADALATSFEGVQGEHWARRGRRSDGADFSVESFGRYMIHDPIHHLHDVGTDLAP
jgi:hypothetical protein